MLEKILKWLKKPFRFDVLDKWLSQQSIVVLDVGCGNHSPQKTKSYYPKIYYYGLNNDASCLDEQDKHLMKDFYLVDLDRDAIPIDDETKFDVIIMSHIIEHLEKGTEVVQKLAQVVKPDGVLYIETPHPRSLNFPSMEGVLNFYDDPTHKRVYSSSDIIPSLENQGFQIIKHGTRRSIKRIILAPIYWLWAKSKGLGTAGVYWDLLGFAYFIVAKKKPI